MRKIISLAIAAALMAGSVHATSCKDPKTGKFIKCPPVSASTGKCRDKSSKKFVKCGTPNSEPVLAAPK